MQISVGIGIGIACLLFVALVGLLVLRSLRRRKHGEGVDQNAPKDKSEALNIAMDGSGLRQTVLHTGQSSNTDQFDFGGDGVEVEDPKLRSTPEFSDNPFRDNKNNGNGNGHRGML